MAFTGLVATAPVLRSRPTSLGLRAHAQVNVISIRSRAGSGSSDPSGSRVRASERTHLSLRGDFFPGSRSFHLALRPACASSSSRAAAPYGSNAPSNVANPPVKHTAQSPSNPTEAWRGRKVLFVSTPVGPLGSGVGGGVELTLYNIAKELLARGVDVEIVAPAGSALPGIQSIVQIQGQPQILAQTLSFDEPVSMPADSTLSHMWEYVLARQDDVDIVVNFAFDWLPLYLSPFLRVPVCHLVSMGSLNLAMDAAVKRLAETAPWTLAFHTRAQAQTFPIQAGAMRTMGNGFDLSKYKFNAAGGEGPLVWVGRIAQEKGLEDAVAAAQKVGLPLQVFGAMQEQEYFDEIVRQFPGADVQYVGFLSTEELSEALGRGRGLLVTPKWEEAFGNVVVEALATGCPAIAYRRGGPQEIVEEGVSGFLVPADDVDALAAAVARLGEISREACRARAEAQFSAQAMGDRVLAWMSEAAARGAPAPAPASSLVA